MSQSKLVPYILPMLPAVSLLTGRATRGSCRAALCGHHLRVLLARLRC